MTTSKSPRLMKDVSREPYGRRALIAAAAELFSERGYAGTSLHDICVLAGTNVALVKYHFGSKEGLYEAMVEYVYETQLKGFLAFDEGVHDETTWQAAVRAWVYRVLDLTGNPELPQNFAARLLASEFAQPSPVHEKVKERFFMPLRESFDRLLRMAIPDDGTPEAQLELALWHSALGAVCFSHAGARPSWYDVYTPKDLDRSTWAKAELDWICRQVFAQLRYRGGASS